MRRADRWCSPGGLTAGDGLHGRAISWGLRRCSESESIGARNVTARGTDDRDFGSEGRPAIGLAVCGRLTGGDTAGLSVRVEQIRSEGRNARLSPDCRRTSVTRSTACARSGSITSHIRNLGRRPGDPCTAVPAPVPLVSIKVGPNSRNRTGRYSFSPASPAMDGSCAHSWITGLPRFGREPPRPIQ